MRGFEDSNSPVVIKVAFLANEVSIDGRGAEAYDFGILVNVGTDRYFVPWHQVVWIKQAQTQQAPANQPMVIKRPEANTTDEPKAP